MDQTSPFAAFSFPLCKQIVVKCCALPCYSVEPSLSEAKISKATSHNGRAARLLHKAGSHQFLTGDRCTLTVKRDRSFPVL